MGEDAWQLQGQVPRRGEPSPDTHRRKAARGLGSALQRVPSRSQREGDSPVVQRLPEHDRPRSSMAYWRLGRPRHQLPHDAEGCGSFHAACIPVGELWWTKPPLRHSRTCHGFDHEWSGSFQASALWVHLPSFQRLHEAAHTPVCHHGDSLHLHLHPRLHRCWGGWSDSPACRATGLPTIRSRFDGLPPLRRQRVSGDVEAHHSSEGAPVGSRPLAAAAADFGPNEVRAGDRPPQGGLHTVRCFYERHPGCDPHGHRQRGPLDAAGA
mmetsp:Transcript_74745/g.103865  ORF Transcript_74745/g.103865 Transcript_74745/m.103865 type:complete len:267 (+) Transcript_74745:227-1027(+)